MEKANRQENIKKENNNFLIGIIVIILIALYSTNPTQKEFNEFISKEVRKKIAEKVGEQNFVGNLVAGFAGTLVNEASVRNDYLIFSTYKVDLSIARMFGAEYSDLKFIGIGGQFIPLSGYSFASPSEKSTHPVQAPKTSTSSTYTSIYYAANSVKNFGWGVGYASQNDADIAAEASCQKAINGNDICKKLIGGAYRCLAIYQNSSSIYAYIDNDLDSAKQNAYANCSKDSALGDVCISAQNGVACANN